MTLIRVLLVDDHPVVRAGLCGLLSATDDLSVVGEAADGEAALAVAADTDPDVVLMDISMPGMDGVTATRRLLDSGFAGAVVMLTSYAERDRVTDALGAGAVGYLLKDSEPGEVLAAIRSAAEGHAPIDPRVAGALLPSRTPAPGAGLSTREREVLGLVAQGLANKQIARRLGITERTVKVHVGNVFRRIGVADRTSAALWARDNLA
ncbi:MAG: two component transcriptional regulator, LuxR family [Marmoricola sp.]|nr:two component transcriptional regulator, LuxR family [Marmoricola sp.]